MISLSVSTSRLSNWTTTRSGIVARSSGAMSMSGAAVTSIPPEWIDRWRGKPSIRAQNSSQRSQSLIPTVLPPRGCGGGSGSISPPSWPPRRLGPLLGTLPRPIVEYVGGGGSQMVRPPEPVRPPARRRNGA